MEYYVVCLVVYQFQLTNFCRIFKSLNIEIVVAYAIMTTSDLSKLCITKPAKKLL